MKLSEIKYLIFEFKKIVQIGYFCIDRDIAHKVIQQLYSYNFITVGLEKRAVVLFRFQ